jgi:hypothetical protein
MESSAFHRPRRMTVYLEQSQTVAELNKALVKAAMEFTPVVRDTTCEKMVGGRKTRYRVASLHALRAATMPALLKHGVFLHQDYCVSDEGVTLVTTLSYGDEFRCSTLPIRQYEDDDRQKAHMTKMRKSGYEGVLCLASEEEGEAVPEGDAPAVAEPSRNGVAPAAMWRQQLMLAKQAVAEAPTSASLDDILSKVKAKIDKGDMDPHHIGQVEEAVADRFTALKQAAAKASPKATQRQEVTA